MAADDEKNVPELTEEEIAEGEAIAVPSSDITGALTGAIDELTEPKSSRGEGEDQKDGGNRR